MSPIAEDRQVRLIWISLSNNSGICFFLGEIEDWDGIGGGKEVENE
ncbi:hypothetical protein [Enterococcus durans]|nr:hypothetical protein [Enterococcus durans]